MSRRCGLIAVIGAPNAGKSTLVNAAVGAKVSIVTHKVQTTRFRIRGVVAKGESQLVFVDTPGIFEPGPRIERAMVAAAWDGAGDADAVCFLVDSVKGANKKVLKIVDRLKERHCEAILVLNKVDLVKPPSLLALAAQLNERGNFSDTFMISALNQDGVADLVDHLAKRMPEGPWLFPDDELSDLPLRIMAAEVTREQAFLQLHDELPYGLAVVTDSWEGKPDGSVKIHQTLLVARDGHKGMALGKGGTRIKSIGEKARREMEDLFDHKVHLFLHVKVEPKLFEKAEHYGEWGLDFNA